MTETMITRTRHSRIYAGVVAAGVGAFLLTGCDVIDSAFGDDTKTFEAATGKEGKAEGVLSDWVPDEAVDATVKQNNLGSGRLLTFTYDGDLPDTCIDIATPGNPTDEELAVGYEQDGWTREGGPDQMLRTTVLDADWWPEGQEEKTTQICGRWWVSNDGDTYYAMATDLRHQN